MKRALIIIGLLSIVVGVAVGQCPHAFFKAHNLRGAVVCESRGCTYKARMASLVPCALEEARYEMSVRFPGRDAAWAEADGPDAIRFVDGIFVAESMGNVPVYGVTDWMEDGTFRTTIGLIGTDEEDVDTMIHEFSHVIAARVLKNTVIQEKFHQQLDNGAHTPWYAARQIK